MNYEGADLIFPHLGIVIKHLNNHITLFGNFDIAFYGIIIGIGMLIALFVIEQDARRHHNDPNLYYDFFIAAIVCGVIGVHSAFTSSFGSVAITFCVLTRRTHGFTVIAMCIAP